MLVEVSLNDLAGPCSMVARGASGRVGGAGFDEMGSL